MIDIRASNQNGTLLLAWLPVNAAMALLYGDPARPIQDRSVLRIYRTKDEAFADWQRITR
jgi:hypothetical protein